MGIVEVLFLRDLLSSTMRARPLRGNGFLSPASARTESFSFGFFRCLLSAVGAAARSFSFGNLLIVVVEAVGTSVIFCGSRFILAAFLCFPYCCNYGCSSPHGCSCVLFSLGLRHLQCPLTVVVVISVPPRLCYIK